MPIRWSSSPDFLLLNPQALIPAEGKEKGGRRPAAKWRWGQVWLWLGVCEGKTLELSSLSPTPLCPSWLLPPSLSRHSIKHRLPHVDTGAQQRKKVGRCIFASVFRTTYDIETRRVQTWGWLTSLQDNSNNQNVTNNKLLNNCSLLQLN